MLAGLVAVLYLLVLAGWQYYVHLETGSWVELPASLAFGDRAYLPDNQLLQVVHYLPEVPQHVLDEETAWALSRVNLLIVPALIGLLFTAVGACLRQYGYGGRIEPHWGPSRSGRGAVY